MKARALKTAVAFYLQSRRRLGFALESEGALLENLVRHARQLRHRGPLTNRLALNWAPVSPHPTVGPEGEGALADAVGDEAHVDGPLFRQPGERHDGRDGFDRHHDGERQDRQNDQGKDLDKEVSHQTRLALQLVVLGLNLPR